MVPMRHSTIFKSRRMALLWAVGILWFAYQVATSQPPDDNDGANAEQANEVLNAL